MPDKSAAQSAPAHNRLKIASLTIYDRNNPGSAPVLSAKRSTGAPNASSIE
jgi:hypothetical protein